MEGPERSREVRSYSHYNHSLDTEQFWAEINEEKSITESVKSHLEFVTRRVGDSANMLIKVLWSDEIRTELFGLGTTCYIWLKLNSTHHPDCRRDPLAMY